MKEIKPLFQIYIHTYIKFSHEKEGNPAICDDMNEFWQCYAKWNKSEKDKYCKISFTCGLKKKKNQLIEQIGGCQNQGMEVGEVSEGTNIQL